MTDWRGGVEPVDGGDGWIAVIWSSEPFPTEAEAEAALSGALGKLNRSLSQEDYLAGWRTGVVKWFEPTKRYGFITPDEGGPDVFIHASVAERAGRRDLVEGQAVTFTAEQQRRGPEAVSLRV